MATSASVYLKLGAKGHVLLQSTNPDVFIRFPIVEKKSAASKSKALSANKALADKGGWLSARKPPATKRKTSATNGSRAASKKPKRAALAKTKSVGRKKAPMAAEQPTEVIDLVDDDDHDRLENFGRRVEKRTHLSDTESEYEFEG